MDAVHNALTNTPASGDRVFVAVCYMLTVMESHNVQTNLAAYQAPFSLSKRSYEAFSGEAKKHS
jgi:hypothetical protein